jgi:hypothetical protein
MGRGAPQLDAVVADAGQTLDGFCQRISGNPTREAAVNPSIEGVFHVKTPVVIKVL